MDRNQKKLIACAQNAYISVIGIEKWNSLGEQQKHDAIMICLRDLLAILDK